MSKGSEQPQRDSYDQRKGYCSDVKLGRDPHLLLEKFANGPAAVLEAFAEISAEYIFDVTAVLDENRVVEPTLFPDTLNDLLVVVLAHENLNRVARPKPA